MTEQTKTRFPAPLYAAAGAGDIAIEQLRKLSDRATASLKAANDQAGTTAVALRDKANTADFDQLRNTATNSALAFAQVASERAIAVYTSLVARGERVVGTGVVEAAEVVNADMEITPATPAAIKPRKRARPAAE